MQNFRFIIWFLFAGILVSSCKSELGNSNGPKPPAMGVINEIVVIADDDVYNGPLGDSLRYYYSSSFPILPTPEPLFDLRHFEPEDLVIESLRKELRTYLILANLKDLDSPTTQMLRKDLGEDRFLKAKESNASTSSLGRDKWARGQMLFYLFANSEDKLVEVLKENFNTIAQKVNEHDEQSLSANIYTARRINKGVSAQIETRYGIKLDIPGDFKPIVDEEENNFIWVRKNKRDAVMNIVISSEKYVDTMQWSKDHIIGFRDTYGRKYVSSDIEGSYMVTNEIDLPIFEYNIDFDGAFAKEIRGIWEMEKDFKGGPFISYAIPIVKTGKIVFIDVFVLAPGTRKRDLMQQLDYIIKSGKLGNTSGEIENG